MFVVVQVVVHGGVRGSGFRGAVRGGGVRGVARGVARGVCGNGWELV